MEATAKAFPDYAILLRFKPSLRSRPDVAALLTAVLPIANVRDYDKDAYELLAEVDCVVANPSSVVAEAIQYRVPTLVLDDHGSWGDLIFRDFPDLCYTDAAGVVARIQALESGAARFEPEAYGRLVGMPPRHWADMVHDDLVAMAAEEGRTA